jgi:hypothetical protein
MTDRPPRRCRMLAGTYTAGGNGHLNDAVARAGGGGGGGGATTPNPQFWGGSGGLPRMGQCPMNHAEVRL